MQDAELLLSLAEIAGVFVGFGALIAVRSGGATEPREIAYMRAVVWMGLWTVVAALAPVTLGRYHLTDHEVLVLSSVVVLFGYLGMAVYSNLTPERRADLAATSRTVRLLAGAAGLVLIGIPMVFALLAIILGLLPELESALYVTAVVLILLGAGWSLLELVFSQRRQTAT